MVRGDGKAASDAEAGNAARGTVTRRIALEGRGPGVQPVFRAERRRPAGVRQEEPQTHRRPVRQNHASSLRRSGHAPPGNPGTLAGARTQAADESGGFGPPPPPGGPTPPPSPTQERGKQEPRRRPPRPPPPPAPAAP